MLSLRPASHTLSLPTGDASYLAQQYPSLCDRGYQSGELDRRVLFDLLRDCENDVVKKSASPESEAESEFGNRYGNIVKRFSYT